MIQNCVRIWGSPTTPLTTPKCNIAATRHFLNISITGMSKNCTAPAINKLAYRRTSLQQPKTWKTAISWNSYILLIIFDAGALPPALTTGLNNMTLAAGLIAAHQPKEQRYDQHVTKLANLYQLHFWSLHLCPNNWTRSWNSNNYPIHCSIPSVWKAQNHYVMELSSYQPLLTYRSRLLYNWT